MSATLRTEHSQDTMKASDRFYCPFKSRNSAGFCLSRSMRGGQTPRRAWILYDFCHATGRLFLSHGGVLLSMCGAMPTRIRDCGCDTSGFLGVPEAAGASRWAIQSQARTYYLPHYCNTTAIKVGFPTPGIMMSPDVHRASGHEVFCMHAAGLALSGGGRKNDYSLNHVAAAAPAVKHGQPVEISIYRRHEL